jgi:hypothetical protein
MLGDFEDQKNLCDGAQKLKYYWRFRNTFKTNNPEDELASIYKTFDRMMCSKYHTGSTHNYLGTMDEFVVPKTLVGVWGRGPAVLRNNHETFWFLFFNFCEQISREL